MRFLRRFLARLANSAKNPEDDGRLREEMEEHLAAADGGESRRKQVTDRTITYIFVAHR